MQGMYKIILYFYAKKKKLHFLSKKIMILYKKLLMTRIPKNLYNFILASINPWIFADAYRFSYKFCL